MRRWQSVAQDQNIRRFGLTPPVNAESARRRKRGTVRWRAKGQDDAAEIIDCAPNVNNPRL